MAHTIIALASLLDNDFYKFTMQQAVVKLFPRAKARYAFINRGKHAFPEGFGEALRRSVAEMSNRKLTQAEKDFLVKTCPYLDPVYLDFLQGYRYNPEEVTIEQNGTEVKVSVEGWWYRTILWEVPLLCLISETYYALTGGQRISDEEVAEKTKEKIDTYNQLGVTVAEFGTRRRHSFAVHNEVVKTLKQYGSHSFVGTSNVYLAMRHQTRPIGTHAHEWFMFHAARYGYKTANTMALEHWTAVYRGDLGIALSDTFTTDEFYRVFDKKFSKLFDGVRHDSGDPVEFVLKTIAHYQQLGIDPLSKTITFSDALNPEKVARIASFCRHKIGCSFGIGTNFTNDVGLQPMNIVMKMTEAQPDDESWVPVVKISDEPGKHSGDEKQIRLAKEILHLNDL